MKKFNNYDLHFRFETKEGVHFENAQYIHPLKQKLVQSYVGCFDQDYNVKAAIIFGSSVEFGCHSFSDLDICIERYDYERGFRNYPEEYVEETDLVYYDAIGPRLKSEIEKKGIVVFDREGLYV
ncbi:MAG: hypothetical protein HFG85_06005 [Dorea sp.]|uniref:nucleotidyltransferase family protein n=1 Tax=Sporofaciens sp. JLR.KK001 TaxID=3112621 RepID=UPI00216F9ABA|nr:hypothetical protein [Dorea sp.]